MDYDVANLALSEEGARRLEWAGRRMPVPNTIRERFAQEKPFDGLKIAACLHVTSETANLMLALRDGGAQVALAASNLLSTQDDIAAALVQEGISVFARRGTDDETYYSHLHSALDIDPDITMDDGADLVNLLHTTRTEITPIGSMEETTTGVIRLRAMAAEGKLRFPVVAVNDSATKHLFDNRFGTGQSAMDGIIRASNVLIAGSVVVVVGFGDCGRGVASRAHGLGARVVVVEIDPIRALEGVLEGYEVMTMDDAAKVGTIFITLTGNKHVIAREHFNVMKDSVIVANAGHFDVELELTALAEMAVSRRPIRENLEQFELPDGRRILVAAEGRLVNLGAAEGHPADVMDLSFSAQGLATEWIVKNHSDLGPKIYTLPTELDHHIAKLKLEAFGAGLQVLTPAQEKYMNSWEEGT